MRVEALILTLLSGAGIVFAPYALGAWLLPEPKQLFSEVLATGADKVFHQWVGGFGGLALIGILVVLLRVLYVNFADWLEGR